MGIALRMAILMQLHREETYHISNPTPELVIRAESARRTIVRTTETSPLFYLIVSYVTNQSRLVLVDVTQPRKFAVWHFVACLPGSKRHHHSSTQRRGALCAWPGATVTGCHGWHATGH